MLTVCGGVERNALARLLCLCIERMRTESCAMDGIIIDCSGGFAC